MQCCDRCGADEEGYGPLRTIWGEHMGCEVLCRICQREHNNLKENNVTNKILRQGDILIVQVENLPKCTPIKDEAGLHILAHGEATGHHHSIRSSDRISMFREDGAGGGLCFIANQQVELEHQEHSTLLIQPGKYEVRRQRTMSSGMVRRVAD